MNELLLAQAAAMHTARLATLLFSLKSRVAFLINLQLPYQPTRLVYGCLAHLACTNHAIFATPNLRGSTAVLT